MFDSADSVMLHQNVQPLYSRLSNANTVKCKIIPNRNRVSCCVLRCPPPNDLECHVLCARVHKMNKAHTIIFINIYELIIIHLFERSKERKKKAITFVEVIGLNYIQHQFLFSILSSSFGWALERLSRRVQWKRGMFYGWLRLVCGIRMATDSGEWQYVRLWEALGGFGGTPMLHMCATIAAAPASRERSKTHIN